MYGLPVPPKPPIAALNVPASIVCEYWAYCGSSRFTLMPTWPSSLLTSVAAAAQSVKLFGSTMLMVACVPPGPVSLPPCIV